MARHNRLVFQLIAQGQITGGGSEADVTGNHIRLPCKAMLVDVDFSAKALAASATAALVLYAGVAAATGTSVATGSITTATPRADGTLAAAYKHKIYAANQEFCLSENTTNTKTIDGLCAVLTFREYEG